MRLAFQPVAKLGLSICQRDFEPLHHQRNSRGQHGPVCQDRLSCLPPSGFRRLARKHCTSKTDNREGAEERKLGKRASSPVPFRAARPPHSGPQMRISKIVSYR